MKAVDRIELSKKALTVLRQIDDLSIPERFEVLAIAQAYLGVENARNQREKAEAAMEVRDE